MDRYWWKTGEKFFINMRKIFFFFSSFFYKCLPPPWNRQKRDRKTCPVDKNRWIFPCFYEEEGSPSKKGTNNMAVVYNCTAFNWYSMIAPIKHSQKRSKRRESPIQSHGLNHCIDSSRTQTHKKGIVIIWRRKKGNLKLVKNKVALSRTHRRDASRRPKESWYTRRWWWQRWRRLYSSNVCGVLFTIILTTQRIYERSVVLSHFLQSSYVGQSKVYVTLSNISEVQ